MKEEGTLKGILFFVNLFYLLSASICKNLGKLFPFSPADLAD